MFRLWKRKVDNFHLFEGIEAKIGKSILNLKDDYILLVIDFVDSVSAAIDSYFTVVSNLFMPKYLKD